MSYDFSDKPNMLAKLTEAYNIAIASSGTGGFAQAYDLLYKMISVDSFGNPLITEANVSSINLLTWDLTYAEKFGSGWTYAPSVDNYKTTNSNSCS